MMVVKVTEQTDMKRKNRIYRKNAKTNKYYEK